MNRKRFVTTLGAAGLGLGLTATGVGAPAALAQEEPSPESVPEDDIIFRHARLEEMHGEFYADFTAALADELGIGNADEVDAAIRIAIMSVIDAHVDDGLFTFGQAEALKTLVATSEVPLGPGPMLAPPHRAVFFGPHRPDGPKGELFPGMDDDSEWTIRLDDGPSRDDNDDRSRRAPDDAETDEEDASS